MTCGYTAIRMSLLLSLSCFVSSTMYALTVTLNSFLMSYHDAHVICRRSNEQVQGALSTVQVSPRDDLFAEAGCKTALPCVLLLQLEQRQQQLQPTLLKPNQRLEVTVDFDTRKYAPPGYAVLHAFTVNAQGEVTQILQLPEPQRAAFLDRNRREITSLFGVIICASLVKIGRKMLEKHRLPQRQKQQQQQQKQQQKQSATTAAAATDKKHGD